MNSPIQTLQRNSNSSINNSIKYVINCREITKGTPTTESWLSVSNQLKATNFDDKNKLLEGFIFDNNRKNKIVVKISDSATLKKEYDIGNELLGINGFIKYHCFFRCNDEYRSYPKQNHNYLCNGPGETMSCLVMPCYTSGNMKLFKFDHTNSNVFQQLLHL